MRLVDADEMLTNGMETKTITVTRRELIETQEYAFTLLFEDWTKFINEQPTIDAVPVVRCKDCKYYRQNKPYLIAGVPIMGNLVCEKWADGCRTDPDGFCFMGERKDDEQV